MASVNRVIILGNLGADPELRYTQSGMAVCTLSVATTDVRNDRDGNRQENTEWHRVVVWNKQAENCAKYLAKGRSVYVEGRLQTRSWDDKQTGQKRYTTEIVAQTVQFIGGGARQDQGQGQYQQQQGAYGGAPQGGPQQHTQGQQQQPAGNFAPAEPAPAQGGEFGAPTTPGLDEIPF